MMLITTASGALESTGLGRAQCKAGVGAVILTWPLKSCASKRHEGCKKGGRTAADGVAAMRIADIGSFRTFAGQQ